MEMDDTDDDDARYPPNPVPPPLQPSYSNTGNNYNLNPFHRPKLPLRTPAPYNAAPAFTTDEEEEEEDDDDDDNDDYDDEEEQGSSENGFSEAQQSDTRGGRHAAAAEEDDRKPVFDRFGVRNAAPHLFPKPEYQTPRDDDWSETATVVLMEAWKEKFLQTGRRSLKYEHWAEIARRVNTASKTAKNDVQCRNRFETLKKKYRKKKKQKKKQKQKQGLGFGGFDPKRVYLKHMDALVGPASSPCQVGLPCGVDAGEFVFPSVRAYMDQTSFDEFRDSPAEEEEDDDVDDDVDGVRGKRRRQWGDESFRVLAESISRFVEIYERIESNKRQQMMELEKMRMEIDRDLEVQKSRIVEQTKVALAKIRLGQGASDEIDASDTNMSG
uniref:Myb/SANT-like DNA-binding domain-containing protein n=1 Tax=Araucaria cunninghamii TaxID=56994 RepID=A0A0D6R0K0_ARACU